MSELDALQQPSAGFVGAALCACDPGQGLEDAGGQDQIVAVTREQQRFLLAMASREQVAQRMDTRPSHHSPMQRWVTGAVRTTCSAVARAET